MSFLKSARTVAALSIAALSIGYTASSHAESAEDDMARCKSLYSLWNKYHFAGRGATSAPNVEIAAAYGECEKGNYASGIAGLTTALERSRIPLPTVEAAKAR
jgi:hypothetical protein